MEQLKKEFIKMMKNEQEARRTEQIKKELCYNASIYEQEKNYNDNILYNIKYNLHKNNICNIISNYYINNIHHEIEKEFFNKNIGAKTLEKMGQKASEILNNNFSNIKVNNKNITFKISYSFNTLVTTELRIYIYFLIDGFSSGSYTDIQKFYIYDFYNIHNEENHKKELSYYFTFKDEVIEEKEAIKIYNHYKKSKIKIEKLKNEIAQERNDFKILLYNNTYNIYEFKDIIEKIEIY